MINAILSPVFQTITIVAFLAACAGVCYLINKMMPQTTKRFADKIDRMGIVNEDTDEKYTNFTIHPSNFVKVPNNR